MGNFGNLFKEAREQKNLSFEQIETDLKIKPQFITAIEEEKFDVFPALPMARGFIKNYAEYLELDPETVENALAESDFGQTFKNGFTQKVDKYLDLAVAGRPRSFINADTIITFLIIIALLGSAAFFVYTQYLQPAEAQFNYTPEPVEFQAAQSKNTPQPTAIAANTDAPVLLPTPTPPPTPTPSPSPTPSPQYYTGVAVELLIHERSWVQILVDDKKVFEGTLEAGERPNWVGEKRVAIRAGNGGGVEVFVNGESKGLMGEPGQVIDQVWEKVDAPPPTDTPAPAETATPTG